MYFKDRKNTNIDDEFDNDNIISKLILLFRKYELYFLIGLAVIILVLLIITFPKNKVTNYLVLNGEENIILYQGDDYIEPGYLAYNSKEENLNNYVKISSTLDVSEIGEYEISYTMGDITLIRKVTIVEKPKEYIYIYLVPVNDSVDMYIEKGTLYKEPGYKVYSNTGKLLTDEVKVTGTIDTSKKGTYQLIYSLVDSNNVTISVVRNVVVMDSEINLTLNTNEYTNGDVTINVDVIDTYFDYLILPNGDKISESSSTYNVGKNGTYKFVVYNNKGISKESSIDVKNIDKIAPTGSCKLESNNNNSIINITANDSSGIKKYVYENKSYTNNKITLSSYVDSVKVIIYDNAGNSKEVSCKSDALPTVTNISNDGVIVTIKAKKVDTDIVGYYFSYTNNRPDENGGYIATNKTSIDVVRLPGTTYVWVKDKNGRISKPVTITLSTSVLQVTKYNGDKILQGTKLSDFLSGKGWSLEEFNKLIARSVRAAGLYTKEGAATAAVSLITVLSQKYKIKVPYWRGGKTNSLGAYSAWGIYSKNPTYEGYYYYGMDCDGLVNWSYRNTGINYSSILNNSYYFWSGIEFSKNNGEVGDVLKTSGHVSIIVGKTDDSFIIAEAYGRDVGIIINKYSFSTKGYTIIKGERLIDTYEKDPKSSYPSGL